MCVLCTSMLINVNTGTWIQWNMCRGQRTTLNDGLHLSPHLKKGLSVAAHFCVFFSCWPLSFQLLSCFCFPSCCRRAQIIGTWTTATHTQERTQMQSPYYLTLYSCVSYSWRNHRGQHILTILTQWISFSLGKPPSWSWYLPLG